MNQAFWKNKKVLITGHTGFKGSWLAFWLHLTGTNVTGYALDAPSLPNLYDLIGLEERINSVYGDVRDFASLKKTVQDSQPEIIFHLAAQPLVRRSYEDPLETFSTNMMGTANLLEIARQTQIPRAVVIVTSDKCYQNNEWLWGYRENDPLGGNDPYSASKAGAELVTIAFEKSFFNSTSHSGTAVASVRAGNVVGGGDWGADRLIPDIMQAFLNGKPVRIRNPRAIRPWQHVLDPLNGYLMLAEKLYTHGTDFSGGWNFGPQAEAAQTVGWIVAELARRWGEDAQWQNDDGPHPAEAHSLKLDSTKAHSLLNWQPQISLNATLDEICAWYRAFQQGDNLFDFMRNEIIDFESH